MDSPRAKYTRITEHSMVNGSESTGREEEIVVTVQVYFEGFVWEVWEFEVVVSIT